MTNEQIQPVVIAAITPDSAAAARTRRMIDLWSEALCVRVRFLTWNGEGDGFPEPYSFWAMEIVPKEAGALQSTDQDSADIGVLTFSVMSNMGKYWDKPAYGTIELTEEGVAFLGKDGADNPLIEGAERVEFVRDDDPAQFLQDAAVLKRMVEAGGIIKG